MTGFWLPGPVLVAGPCVVESDGVNLRIANVLAEIGAKLGIRVVFKASFDKANRAARGAPRGPGLRAGLEALRRVRTEVGLPVITDVHDPAQVPLAAETVDALQVPAFLCRQTDLLEAVGSAGLPVNIKKGQWMSPGGMGGAVEKVRARGSADIAVTERGTFFGYGDLVVDMRNFAALRVATELAVLFDATHAVQQPGRGPGGASGGRRGDVPALLAAAAAAGADGFFIETHADPALAPSDAATMWPLADLERLVERTLAIWHGARGGQRHASGVR